MLKVGLTGGMASGKSVVAAELARLGCHVIHADLLGHEVLKPGGEAYEPVLKEFGTADRKQLGAIVFQDQAKLHKLNSIVHPAVKRLTDARMASITHGILVYEAAILVETGGYRNFDKLIVAACPESLQVERAMARDGSSREEVLSRLRNQMPLSDKLKVADFVIDTSGSMEHTLEQTRSVFKELNGATTV